MTKEVMLKAPSIPADILSNQTLSQRQFGPPQSHKEDETEEIDIFSHQDTFKQFLTDQQSHKGSEVGRKSSLVGSSLYQRKAIPGYFP
jgi:hypothetical protein